MLNVTEAQKANSSKQVVTTKLTESPQQKASALIQKMTAVCNLKPDQADKISKAFIEYYTKHDDLKKQKDILDKSSYDDRSESMKKTRDAILKSTLTATQYKQWSIAKNKEKKSSKKDKAEE